MSVLSQKCKHYLDVSGYTPYSFARSSGLDISEIHRLLKGNILPKFDFFKQFCANLRINDSERQELFELYEAEDFGYAAYQNRRYIAQMISGLAAGEYLDPLPSTPSDDMEAQLQTHIHIYKILEKIFSQEDCVSEIYCNFPIIFPFSIFDYLIRLYQSHPKKKKIKFHHLITFSSNPAIQTDSNRNLKIFHQILPLIFSGFDEYLPCYCYHSAAESDYYQLAWPYYLVTEDTVLQLSADGNLCIIHHKPEQVAWYREELRQTFQNTHPFLLNIDSPREALQFYFSHSWPLAPFLGSLTSLPCMIPYIAPELLMEYFSSLHLPKETLENFSKSSDDACSKPCAFSFFTQDGLQNFWQTGVISGQVAAAFSPLPPKKRREILLQFIKRNNGKISASRLLTLDLAFPPNLYIELMPNHQLLLCMIHEKAKIHFTFFDESSIYDACMDFFKYLASDNNSLSIEETNRFIRNLLETKPCGCES